MSAEPRDRRMLRGLYAITPEMADTRALVGAVEKVLAGGARIVQYRAKSLEAGLRREQACALAAACRRHRAAFLVNDSIDLALDADADGVHLGREDGDVRAARERIGDRFLGVSCYDDAVRARTAAEAGADYVGIGSVFASSTKPGAVRAPLARLGEAHHLSGLPVAAIGGITLANARDAIAAGADMLAVISALFDASDPQAAARSFANLFDERNEEPSDVRAQPRAV